MTYDERKKEYGLPTNDIRCQCDSVCLAHSVLYHSATVLPALPLPPLMDSKVVIAYHITSKEKAIEILEKGFPVDDKKQVKDEVFFHLHIPTTTTPGTSEDEVIICARLCMDHVLQVDKNEQFNFNKHATKTPEPKGLELMPQRNIKVKFPRQIEKWMVIFRSNVLNSIHPSGYQGLI